MILRIAREKVGHRQGLTQKARSPKRSGFLLCRPRKTRLAQLGTPAITSTRPTGREISLKSRAAVPHPMGAPSSCAESGPLGIEEIEVAPPCARETPVRVRAAGLRPSTPSVVNDERPRTVPMVLGYEAAGKVVECRPLFAIDHHDCREGRLSVDRLMNGRPVPEENSAGFDRLAGVRVARQIVKL